MMVVLWLCSTERDASAEEVRRLGIVRLVVERVVAGPQSLQSVKMRDEEQEG